jgi:nucleotide-binding universal stress UspA family protein
MYDDVLVPTDGSDGTEAALEHALAIAGAHDAALHGLYVVDRRRYTAAPDDSSQAVLDALEAEGRDALGIVEVRGADAGVETATTQREGVPHGEILEYATAEDVDLIVMGTHGRTGRDRLANLGSTTERVVKNGDVPVLVVDID